MSLTKYSDVRPVRIPWDPPVHNVQETKFYEIFMNGSKDESMRILHCTMQVEMFLFSQLTFSIDLL